MDQVSRALLAVGGGVAEKTYVDDVFSTYLYSGNSAAQTITNDVNLSANGGLVWIKPRNFAESNLLVDTARGTNSVLASESTTAALTGAPWNAVVTAFNSSGFTVGATASTNTYQYASWTFRKSPKFFDVVAYTGDGTNRDIAHSLGAAPGAVIVKQTSGAGGDWYVNVTALTGAGNSEYLRLNSTSGSSADATVFRAMDPTSTTFPVGSNSGVNANGATYVAYIFGHDTTADGMIRCGTFTTDASGNASVTSLGWEPQWLLIKRYSTTGSWYVIDVMRGAALSSGSLLFAESNVAEQFNSQGYVYPTATGFDLNGLGGASSDSYVYIAIRRPNKPPTTGTQVFMPTVYTGTNTDNRLLDTGLLTDMVWLRRRDAPSGAGNAGSLVGDRLSGQAWLRTALTQTETTTADGLDQQLVGATEYGTAFSAMSGVWIGNNAGVSDTAANINVNTTSNSHIALAFKRAPGFFDVVRYTGTGIASTVSHSLGVAPEFVIVKARNAVAKWAVYWGPEASAALNEDNLVTDYSVWWSATQPTASVFTVGTDSAVNGSATRYVAYLFATLPGVSKVGSYTGNGSTTVVDCGFSSGARFVLIRRKPNGGGSAGDWWFWDSARGIVAAGEPVTSLNTSAVYLDAELTGTDAIDPYNPGFAVNQVASTSVNANGVPYFFLAIA